MLVKKSSTYYDAVEVQSQISFFTLTQPIEAPPRIPKRALSSLIRSIKEPSIFGPFELFEVQEESLPWAVLPVNLKRMSEAELGSLFISIGNGINEAPIRISPHLEMFQAHGRQSLIGFIFIQNKTPHVLTFRVRPSRMPRNPKFPQIFKIPVLI